MKFIEVDSVESLDYEGKVHDIEVQVDHCYTANGYSVHNSAAGSLVNYLLGITDVDPLKWDLMFERFLDISRADVVDIDMDYEPRVRDAVIDHVIEKYGSNQVAAIGTFGTTKTKVAVQDAARVMGIPIQDTLHITKNVLGPDVDDDAPWEQLVEENAELKAYLDKYKDVKRNGKDLSFFIKGIRNAQRSISQHAAGVLITSDNLMENVPLIRASKRTVTGWQEGSDFRELSDLGYYKFDVLGLNNLQVVNDAVTLIEQRRGIKIDLNSLDLEDPEVYRDIINKHDHFGVFQFESVLARKLMKDVAPQTFEQLSAVSAILRPGPLRMGMDKEFAMRKRGLTFVRDEKGELVKDLREKIKNDKGQEIVNPNFKKEMTRPWSLDETPECLQKILGPTLGIVVYQEQFMLIAMKFGMSNKEVNSFRKALVKYEKSAANELKRIQRVESYHRGFLIGGAKLENYGVEAFKSTLKRRYSEEEASVYNKIYDKNIEKFVDELLEKKEIKDSSEQNKLLVKAINMAEDMWQLIRAFAAYGFNKSHSISYTYVSFREYWLKKYYDPEFNVALLNNTDKGKESKGDSVISNYITECMKKEYKVLLPSVNYSEKMFSLKSDKEIVWGMGWIKGLSETAIDAILKDRTENGKYPTLTEFLRRIDKKLLNKRAVESLIWSGCFDEYINSDIMKEDHSVVGPNFELEDRFRIHEYIFKTFRKEKNYKPMKFNEKKLIELEEDMNTISLSEIVTFAQTRIAAEKDYEEEFSMLFEVKENKDDATYKVIAKVEGIEKKKTKTGKEYVRATMRDETAKLQGAFVWPWKCKNWDALKKGQFVLATIQVENGFTNLIRYSVLNGEDEDEGDEE